MSPVRQPAGIPVGGQFAPGAHAEPDVSLTTPDGAYSITGEEIVAFASQAARSKLRNHSLIDATDLECDVIDHYLRARRNAIEKYAAGLDAGVEPPVGGALANPGAYMQTVAGGLLDRLATGLDQSCDRSAMREYLARRDGFAQTTGRKMTADEEDELAASIREDQPKGRRAFIGFHRRVANPEAASLDSGAGTDDQWDLSARRVAGDSLGRSISCGHVGRGEFAEGTVAARVMDLLDEGGRTSRAEAKAGAWDAIAEANGVPMVHPGSVSPSEATAHRRFVQEAGGPAGLAARWRDETATAAECRALFAPFGQPQTFEAQSAVVDTLDAAGDYGADIYESALKAATRRRSKLAAA